MDTVVAVAAGTGCVVAANQDEGHNSPALAPPPAILCIPLVPVALIAGISALYGFQHISAHRAAVRRETVTNDAIHAKERTRMDAWALTKSAAAAARADDCGSVQRLDFQVRALDSKFHETVFLVDLGIKRCLSRSAPAPTLVPSDLRPPPATGPVSP